MVKPRRLVPKIKTLWQYDEFENFTILKAFLKGKCQRNMCMYVFYGVSNKNAGNNNKTPKTCAYESAKSSFLCLLCSFLFVLVEEKQKINFPHVQHNKVK